ncbi:MAG TPA: homocysteine S-methyltransferase family protein [Gemmataceae bacterium]|nr:homocysteine S-methyltransferase family protein [Gemmataceae bacterium]
MSRFLDTLHSGRALLMDGAMGTELIRAGLPPGKCGELWNLTHPEQVGAIHQAYVEAGAEILLTNTFQANPATLARYGLDGQLVAIHCRAATLARTAAGLDRFVLADVGPIQRDTSGEEFTDRSLLRRSIRSLEGDGILLETCSTPRVRWAVKTLAPYENARPVLLSLTYQRDPAGKLATRSGHAPEWFARRAKAYGVAALGVNCGRDIGMDDIIDIIRRYRAATDLPLFARPNAGTPTKQGDRWIYPQTPEAMAARLPELLEAGASMIGGCCGTTPAHIAAFRTVIDAWKK